MKFRVSPPYRIPDLVSDRTGVTAVSKPVVQELEAVYWDTSDLRLAREGITLRHRSGEGSGDDWHLKLPVNGATVPDASTGARDELHADGPDSCVPEQLRDLVEVYLRSAVLGPVATLQTTRTAYTLLGPEGNPLAELTDDLVSVLNLGHVAGRFREIEVEDKGGGVGVLEDVATVLRAHGAVGGEFVPKVVRALGPRAPAAAAPPPPAPVTADDPARAALQSVLRRYVRLFMANDQAVRRELDDGVHQMRVAARRLRSALKTFRPLVDADWADSLRDELKWVADSLGGARDAEVLLSRLMADLDSLPPRLVIGPVRSRIEQTVGGELASATATAGATLRSERYVALVDRLVVGAWDPMTSALAESATGEVLPDLIASAWNRLAKGAARIRRPESPDSEWHRTRIAAKQARYAAEAVAPIFGKPAKTLGRQAEEVQDLLGEHQDAVVAADTLYRLAVAPRAGSVAFTLGVLHARQEQVIARTRAEFPAVWARAGDAKHRQWLDN